MLIYKIIFSKIRENSTKKNYYLIITSAISRVLAGVIIIERNSTMPKVKCSYCGKIFNLDKSILKRGFKNHFCSTQCKAIFQHKKNDIKILGSRCVMYIDDKKIAFDTLDLDLILQYKWRLKFDPTINNYYVVATERGTHKYVALHRLITHCPEGMQVDHIDRNPLNNTRVNLKVCSTQENACNKGFYKNNKTGYKNISLRDLGRRYLCEIRRNNKVVFRKSSMDLLKLVALRDEFLKGGDNTCQ